MAVWRRGSRWRRTGHLSTEADRATFRTLHTASLAAPALRGGLNRASAERAVGHLRELLGTPSVVLTDTSEVLAWDGDVDHHRDLAEQFARDFATGGAAAGPPRSTTATSAATDPAATWRTPWSRR